MAEYIHIHTYICIRCLFVPYMKITLKISIVFNIALHINALKRTGYTYESYSKIYESLIVYLKEQL